MPCLVTKSLRAAFEGVDYELEAAARTLGRTIALYSLE